MSIHLKNFTSQALSEVLPFGFNSVSTGALTLAGQYAPKVVEALSFDMEPKSLGFGAVYTSLAGSFTKVIVETIGSDKTKSQAAQILIYAAAAFGSAYFMPQAATSAGYVISKENAMAVALASTVSNFICMMLQNP